MKTDNREMLVGGAVFTVLLALILLSYGGRTLAARSDTGYYRLHATFNRVDGLLEGDEVRMSGIKVGTVGAMKLDPNFRADLILRIQDNVKVPRDSSASIQTSGLFGSKYVVLEPGGDEANFKPGDKFTFTQDATIVSELLDMIISEGRARNAEIATEEKAEEKKGQ